MPIDEETLLLAQLANSTNRGINQNLVQDKNYNQLAATLNHRDILLGGRGRPVEKLTRGDIIQQQAQGHPQFPPNRPVQNYPIPPRQQDVVSQGIIDSPENSFPLNATPPQLLPMPSVPHGGYPPSEPNYTPINTDFHVPDFIAPKPVQPPPSDLSAVVMLRAIYDNVSEIIEKLETIEKKVNRTERKINEIYKHLGLAVKSKKDNQPTDSE